MKQKEVLYNILICILLFTGIQQARTQGIPFLRNYTSVEYKAHNRNFDVITGKDGTVYVANFEGLMYYDQSRWRILHTPGITRITSVFCDHSGRIWVGGYNFMGYVSCDKNGELHLVNLLVNNKTNFHGEVNWLWEKNGEIQFLSSDNRIYRVKNNTIRIFPQGKIPSSGNSVLVSALYVNQIQKITSDIHAVATTGSGIIITDERGKEMFRVTEANGLCSNNVNHITYNGHGLLWGATDNGVFSLAIPSIYTHFTSSEGLKGEVLCINTIKSSMYIGTLNGLYRRYGNEFKPVANVNHACWQLEPYNNGLLAATSDGVYFISSNGNVDKINGQGATSVLAVNGGYISGELDGVFLNIHGGKSKLCKIEKVTKIFEDKRGNLWLGNLYGQVWMRKKGSQCFKTINIGSDSKQVCTLVTGLRDVVVVNSEGAWMWNGQKLVKQKYDRTFDFPLFSYTDAYGYTWLTNAEGKQLYAVKNGKRYNAYDKLLIPLAKNTVRALYRVGHQLWLGGDFGLITLDNSHYDPFKNSKSKLRITSIVLNSDSLLWGGFNEMPSELKPISSNSGNLVFNYSLNYSTLLGNSLYRYKLNGKQWSEWSNDTYVKLINLHSGNYTLKVQACDAAGRLSNVVSIDFFISYPFYLRWYMLLIYILLFAFIIYGFVKWRMQKLIKDKEHLEKLVDERTAVINQQKDELVRQEKMATVGKLTQGLIDRILNPLNYINNFSKLSQGLIKDATANIEDEKENMDKDNYEDTIDVFEMLKTNLDKVQEHGNNTTRTLKAMEELLKDHTGTLAKMNLSSMLRQCEQITLDYYKQDIAQYNIRVKFSCPEGIFILGCHEQLSKTVMSLIANAIYALKKKASKVSDFAPEVNVSVELKADAISAGETVRITIRDNGIGIEDAILEKIFDPFFTTKTTGEAAGVGLYLSREIAQNHHGDIVVNSEKGEFTQFTIILPQKNNEYGTE